MILIFVFLWLTSPNMIISIYRHANSKMYMERQRA